MPEENKDANTKVEDSSESTNTENTENLSAENASSEDTKSSEADKSSNEPFHKHPRFQELVKEKNELKNKLSQMESVLNEKFAPPRPDPIALAKKELSDLGVEEKAAEKILNAAKLAAKAELEPRMQAVEQADGKREMDSWLANFAKDHADYKEVEPQMFDVFEALPDNTKSLIVSDPMGIQLLYDHVKVQNMKEEIEKSYKKGTEDAYKNKQNKSSISPTPGGSKNPPGELTRKSLSEMSLAEYKKLRDEIGLAAINAKLAQEKGD